MNIARIEGRHKAASERSYGFDKRGSKEYPFNLLALRNLEPGRYRGRFLWPDPNRNPDGMYEYITHFCLQADKTKEKIMAAECLPKGEGYPGISSALRIIDEHGLFDKLVSMGDKTKALRAAIEALVPWRRYWTPVYLYATEKPPLNPDGYPTYAPCWDAGATPLARSAAYSALAAARSAAKVGSACSRATVAAPMNRPQSTSLNQ